MESPGSAFVYEGLSHFSENCVDFYGSMYFRPFRFVRVETLRIRSFQMSPKDVQYSTTASKMDGVLDSVVPLACSSTFV